MTAAQFVGLLFLGRDVAHSVHLNTRSFSKHKALRRFYNDVIDLADSFAEAYSGRHGLIGQIAVPANKKTANIIDFLQGQLDEIEKKRYEVVDQKDTAIQNIIDEIVALYLSTLYKLRFLA
jgi:chloramphenicol O-acetyltransferase